MIFFLAELILKKQFDLIIENKVKKVFMYPNYDKESGSGHYMRLVAFSSTFRIKF